MHAETVSLADLAAGKCDAALNRAFGPKSLGILVIKELSSEYLSLRKSVLSSAKQLAELPAENLALLEVPESHWIVGWSRGRETLANGQPDINKGSFYVNCNFVRRPGQQGPDKETVEKYPQSAAYVHGNVWPEASVIPKFQENLQKLIAYMVHVTETVAKACDHALESQLAGLAKPLEEIVANSDTHKARLLHYYIPESANDPWCGEHLDHSCLTALTSALWGPEPVTETGDAGLWIRSRDGSPVKVDIPDDCIAIQTGSALEALTQGRFKAVPHRVAGDPRFWRSTLAIFCQPRLDDVVGDTDFATFAEEIITKFQPAAEAK